MENLIVIGILLILVGAAVFYIWKQKKKGSKCIGCPHAGCCSNPAKAPHKEKPKSN